MKSQSNNAKRGPSITVKAKVKISKTIPVLTKEKYNYQIYAAIDTIEQNMRAKFQ